MQVRARLIRHTVICCCCCPQCSCHCMPLGATTADPCSIRQEPQKRSIR
jgi:hypothetical protein